MSRLNLLKSLKRIYSQDILQPFFDAADFSCKEIRLLKNVSKMKFCSLKKIIHSFNEPEIFIYQNDSLRYPHINTSGKSFFSEKKAFLSAVGETIERFNWYNYQPVIEARASFSSIKKNAVDPSAVAGFSEEQMAASKDAVLQWVKVTDLVSNKKKLCPAQLVGYTFFKKIVMEQKKEPALRVPVSTGVAAGWSRDEVIYRGILESIERDAFMITYLNKITPVQINFHSTKLKISGDYLDVYFEKFNLEAHSVVLVSDLPPYSIMSFLIDRNGTGPALSVGACTDFDIESAILRSLEEAMTVRLFGKAEKLHERELRVSPSAFRQLDRKIYWSNIENLHHIDFMLKGPRKNISELFISDVEMKKNKMISEKIIYMLSELKKNRYECLYIDTATGEGFTGVASGTVLIPELHPMHLDEKFSYMSGKRLRDVPKKLGYDLPREVNIIPHPFH